MTPPVETNDHAAWATYWGDQTLRAIAKAVSRPPQMVTPQWDIDLEDVARCARAAWGRASRLSDRQLQRAR